MELLTPAEIADQKSQHENNIREYNERQAVRQALRNQLIDAIPSEYLDALRNAETDMINCYIPDIITYLQDIFLLNDQSRIIRQRR